MPPAAYFIGKIVMVLTMVVLESVVLLAIGGGAGQGRPADRLAPVGHLRAGSPWSAWPPARCWASPSPRYLAPERPRRPSSPRSRSILQFLSGVYFVFTTLPPWLQTVGAIFPLKWIAQGYRSVFLPDELRRRWSRPGTGSTAGSRWYCWLWAVGGLFLALRTFRWRASRDA